MSSSSNNPKPSVVTGYPAATNGGDPPSTTSNEGDAPAAAAAANDVPTATAIGVPTATAYPYYPNPNPNPNAYYYYAPNPNPNPNPYYYYPPNPNPNPYLNRNLFLRRLIIIFISAFVAIGAATMIVYLVLRPKIPSFAISSLSVSSLNLTSPDSRSSLNLTSPSSLSSIFDLSFSVENPNSKLTVSYDHILANVAIEDNSLASAYLPSFSQSKRNVTTISTKMPAVEEFVGADAVGSIHSGRGNGVVRLDVRLVAVVRFWSGAWRTRRHELRVFCGGVGVAFRNGSSTAGSMTDGPRQCWVGI